MKKLITLILLLGVGLLSGCSTESANDLAINGLTEQESIATIAYLSSGLLNFSAPVEENIDPLRNLTDSEPFEIEEEIDEVNQYMEQLKVFMEEGTENFGKVEEVASDNPLYDFRISFVVQGTPYIVYYNIDELTNEYTGIIVLDGVSYELEASLIDEDIDNDDEEHDEIEDETEIKTELRLTARNSEDYVTITYKKEIEEDESSLKFNMYVYKNKVERQLEMKISHEENEMKIQLNENGNEFTFKKEVESGETTYKLKYKLGDTEGEVKIQEMEDENGTLTYKYQIKEKGLEKEIDLDKPGHENDHENEKENDNDNENDDEPNENSNGEGSNAT